MDYLFFLLKLVHVLAGLLFIGLPMVVWVGVWRTRGRAWNVWLLGLQHALMAGLLALAGGLLIAGFQWDNSFEQAWRVVGNRWIFGFIEFGFSAGLIAAIVLFCPQWPAQRWRQRGVLVLIFLAATNAWYHFPALMIVSREIRWRPELVAGLEGAVVRQLLFSPEILSRWLHVALASVMVGSVWLRFLVGVVVDQDEASAPGLDRRSREEWGSLDRFLRQATWSGLLALWASGLVVVGQLPAARLNDVLALGSGKSNNLMIGILAANAAALKTLMPESQVTGLGRFVEVGLVIAAVTAMLVR